MKHIRNVMIGSSVLFVLLSIVSVIGGDFESMRGITRALGYFLMWQSFAAVSIFLAYKASKKHKEFKEKSHVAVLHKLSKPGL